MFREPRKPGSSIKQEAIGAKGSDSEKSGTGHKPKSNIPRYAKGSRREGTECQGSTRRPRPPARKTLCRAYGSRKGRATRRSQESNWPWQTRRRPKPKVRNTGVFLPSKPFARQREPRPRKKTGCREWNRRPDPAAIAGNPGRRRRPATGERGRQGGNKRLPRPRANGLRRRDRPDSPERRPVRSRQYPPHPCHRRQQRRRPSLVWPSANRKTSSSFPKPACGWREGCRKRRPAPTGSVKASPRESGS